MLSLSIALIFCRILFWSAHRRTPVPAPHSIFDQVLGHSGLTPLGDFSQDELQRGPLLESLVGLVSRRRTVSIVFGLEGAWGSGKTSLLNGLQQGLSSQDYPIVVLSSWNYREPERILRAYFDHIERQLGRTLALPNLKRSLYKLAAGLADLGPGKIASVTGKYLTNLSEASIGDIREGLEEALRQLDKPMIVLIDDLDRIESDELKAVLRAIRLVSDLPNLTHILAYDREQLSKNLFPEDKDGFRARDYLGKIINIELSIGNPPSELARTVLENSLQPLLTQVGETNAKHFVKRIQRQPLDHILQALQTPREIRRVSAAAAWIWERMNRELNVFDLFILTAIQYRFPVIYRTMRSHPEWFTVVDWSDDPWRIAFREDWVKQRGEYFQKLKGSEHPEEKTAFILLQMIMPGIAGKDLLGHLPQEIEARRERRILHPHIFNRYFHLYIPQTSVTEKEIEDFAEEISQSSSPRVRQEEIRDRIFDEIDKGRIDSFWDQWEIALNPENLPENLIRDLCLGIGMASDRLPDTTRLFSTAPRRMGIFKILRLAAKLESDQSMNDLLVEIVETASSTEVGGYIVQVAREGKTIFKDRDPDLPRLEDALNNRVELLYRASGRPLLSASKGELGSVILWTGDRDMIGELVLRDLRKDPKLLPSLLKVAAPERVAEEGDEEEVSLVEGFNAKWLSELVPVQQAQELTATVPLSDWENSTDREFIERFREWIKNPTLGDKGPERPE
ncbi:MAG TPA: P-loop NTPase fold protein [Thermoanaerobaculia bacterium]|nr:P-loop NTPase fold protein [Thermoanaerobaculia bacterium]